MSTLELIPKEKENRRNEDKFSLAKAIKCVAAGC